MRFPLHAVSPCFIWPWPAGHCPPWVAFGPCTGSSSPQNGEAALVCLQDSSVVRNCGLTLVASWFMVHDALVAPWFNILKPWCETGVELWFHILVYDSPTPALSSSGQFLPAYPLQKHIYSTAEGGRCRGCWLQQGAAGGWGERDVLSGPSTLPSVWYAPQWSYSRRWGVWQGDTVGRRQH